MDTSILEDLGLESNGYFLLTAHREENVDIRDRLSEIIVSVKFISVEYNTPIIYPIHPRTQKRIQQFDLEDKVKEIDNLRLIDPVGYMDFIWLLSNARCVLTDSGGVQEESCILKVPCVTLRESTERPETLDVGSNMIAGTDMESIKAAVKKMLEKDRNWTNPFWDGRTSSRIVDIVLDVST